MTSVLTAAADPAAPAAPAAPYLHASLAGRSLAGAVADRDHWSADDLRRLTDLLTRTAPRALREAARHDPEHRWYLRLALTAQVEVWLIGWAPGQGTRPHDHGGASGAFTVLDGTLAETWREPAVPITRDLVTPLGGSTFGPARIHQVANPGTLNATSVHAYSPPLLPLGEVDSLDTPILKPSR
jgi:predicted metal-dependent enzyme (double-stranded beta helix superfamily)